MRVVKLILFGYILLMIITGCVVYNKLGNIMDSIGKADGAQ